MTRPLKLKHYSNASTWCYLFFTAHVALTFSYSAHIQMKPLQQFFVFCMSRNNLFSVFCLQVFFSVVIGAMQLGQAGPNFQAIVTARGAAYKVFLIIDRVKRCIYCLKAVQDYYSTLAQCLKSSGHILALQLLYQTEPPLDHCLLYCSLSSQLALACNEEFTRGNILINELY